MMGDKLKDMPLLSQADIDLIFTNAWNSNRWRMPRATKANPNRLMTVRCFMSNFERMAKLHIQHAVAEAVHNHQK